MERILFLDGWRGLAILGVLVGHFFSVPGINIGHLGVELFFVLSGRLMAEILFIRKTPLGKFFKRRISRIYPALLFFVAVVFVPASYSTTLMHTKRALAQWPDALSALTFTTNYVEAIFTRGTVFTHTWSLSVEEHAYLLLALFAFATKRDPQRATLWMFVGVIFCIIDGVISTYIFSLSDYQVYWRTDVRVASIFSSAALYLVIRDANCKIPYNGGSGIVAFLAGVLLFFDFVPNWIQYSLGTISLAYAVNTLDFSPISIRKFLSCRPIVWIGTVSYSIYLWQQPFYGAVNSFKSKGDIWIVALVLGAIVCGAMSFYFIETPARRFLNRRFTASNMRGQDEDVMPVTSVNTPSNAVG